MDDLTGDRYGENGSSTRLVLRDIFIFQWVIFRMLRTRVCFAAAHERDAMMILDVCY